MALILSMSDFCLTGDLAIDISSYNEDTQFHIAIRFVPYRNNLILDRH